MVRHKRSNLDRLERAEARTVRELAKARAAHEAALIRECERALEVVQHALRSEREGWPDRARYFRAVLGPHARRAKRPYGGRKWKG